MGFEAAEHWRTGRQGIVLCMIMEVFLIPCIPLPVITIPNDLPIAFDQSLIVWRDPM
jgi:hypothetical protein